MQTRIWPYPQSVVDKSEPIYIGVGDFVVYKGKEYPVLAKWPRRGPWARQVLIEMGRGKKRYVLTDCIEDVE